MNKVIFIFLDGVGIGKSDKINNPFFKYSFDTFNKLFSDIPSINNQFLNSGNKFVFPIDTILDVPELPQSGTGQTSLFCGFNSQKYLGKHFGPYPHTTLHPFIKEKNIFFELIKKNKKPYFANAYPEIYFEHLTRGLNRVSVPSLCSIYSDLKLNNYEDLKNQAALSPEIDNHRWVQKLKYDLPIISAEKAAENLLGLTANYDFVLFEYFFTDYFGHGRLNEEFENMIFCLDKFLYTVLSTHDKNDFVIITTDHGNFEDLSTKSHTLNPGLTIVSGKKAEKASKVLKNISQIKEFILNEVF